VAAFAPADRHRSTSVTRYLPLRGWRPYAAVTRENGGRGGGRRMVFRHRPTPHHSGLCLRRS
jgi:hypothetical protein